MEKIKYFLMMILVLGQGVVSSIEPNQFRIRSNGVLTEQIEVNQSNRSYQIQEARAVKKLSGDLEARAVVLGLQIRNVKSNANISRHVFAFIEQIKNDFGLEISDENVKTVATKYFLQYGEQAYLLTLVQEADKKVDDKPEASVKVAVFFEELEDAFDTDTIDEYLSK